MTSLDEAREKIKNSHADRWDYAWALKIKGYYQFKMRANSACIVQMLEKAEKLGML